LVKESNVAAPPSVTGHADTGDGAVEPASAADDPESLVLEPESLVLEPASLVTPVSPASDASPHDSTTVPLLLLEQAVTMHAATPSTAAPDHGSDAHRGWAASPFGVANGGDFIRRFLSEERGSARAGCDCLGRANVRAILAKRNSDAAYGTGKTGCEFE
jgi:hypothetical protein